MSEIIKTVEKTGLTVSRVYSSDFQKEGTLTAEVKQTVISTAKYPTKSVANSLSDNIFGMSEFNFEEKEYENKEKRVAWIDVPPGSTIEGVMAKLANFPEANLYRILSNKPILSEEDQYAINSSEIEKTLDDYANSQVVRYGSNHDEAGKIALDKQGKIQYRRIAFARTVKDDQDLRTMETSDFYASPELKNEMTGVAPVIEGQSI